MKGKRSKIAAVAAVLALSVGVPMTPLSGLSDMIAVTASAEEISGTSGNCEWTLSDGTLTISAIEGTDGRMANYVFDASPFYRNTSIRSVVVEDGVTYIGKYAFYKCTSINSVSLPSSLESIGDQAFNMCTSITSVSLPSSLKSIGYLAFGYDQSLETIELPEGLESIGDDAFGDCSALSAYTVAEGNDHFASEDGVLFNKEKTDLIAYPAGKTDTSYIVPDTVTTIKSFGYNEHLTELTLPAGLQKICKEAFFNCTALTTIDLSSCTSLSTIGRAAFGYCSSLRAIDLSGCTALTNFDPLSAFRDCQALTTVSLPAGVTDFEFSEAFNNCPSLTAVNIAAGNTAFSSVDGVVFDKAGNKLIYCPNGRTGIYTVPSSVNTIADSAFKYCPEDLKIVFESVDPPILEGWEDDKFQHFGLRNSERYIYVPASAVENYQDQYGALNSYAPELIIEGYYTVTIPYQNVEIVNDESDKKLTDGKYLDGAQISFKIMDGYTVQNVTANREKLVPDANGVYTATVDGQDLEVSVEYVFSDNIGAHLAGYSLSLDGDIGVDFYMDLDDSVLNDPDTYYMLFTTPSGTQKVPLDLDNTAVIGNKTYYKFKCRIYADEMTKDIKAQMFRDTNEGTVYHYTVQNYAQRIIDAPDKYDETTRALAQAALDYGAAAQVFFGTDTEDLAAPDYLDRVASVDIEERTYTDNTPEDITYVGSTLTIQSETTLSLYFDTNKKLKFSADGYKVEKKIVKVDGVRCQVARIRGIKSEDLGNDIVLNIEYADGSCTVTNSPMAYCYIGSTDSEANLPELCKAMYNYWKAAAAYKAAHPSQT